MPSPTDIYSSLGHPMTYPRRHSREAEIWLQPNSILVGWWVVGGQHRALAALFRGGIRYPFREAGLASRTCMGTDKLVSTKVQTRDRPSCRKSLCRLTHVGRLFETRHTDFPVGIKLLSFKITCVHWKTDVPLY